MTTSGPGTTLHRAPEHPQQPDRLLGATSGVVGLVAAPLGRRGVEVSGMTDMWSYRDTARTQTTDVVGFEVVATDGSIGKVDQATYDAGASYLVVDTGPWIFGKRRMLPAGVIERIDYDGRQVFVNLTKDQIRDAPDYDADRDQDETYRSDLGTYYGPY
jgi:PRC-barrel domain protein